MTKVGNFIDKDKEKLVQLLPYNAVVNPTTRQTLDKELKGKADAEDVVDLTGDQEISGAKTFNDPLRANFALLIDTRGLGSLNVQLSQKASASQLTALQTEVGKKYEKPASGIPSTDLSSAVQTSISRADAIYNDYINAQNLM